MPVLSVRRDTPLTTAETAALPGGALPVRGEGDIVARARIRDMAQNDLLRMAFAMGQAVPGGSLDLGEPREPEVDTAQTWELPVEETAEEAAYPDDRTPPEEEPTLDPLPPVDPPQPEGDEADEELEELEELELEDAEAEEPSEAVDPAAERVAAAPEEPAPESTELVPVPPVAAEPEPVEDADTLVPDDPWRLWEEGDEESAWGAFGAHELDSKGRARVRAMLQSTDPAQVAVGCRIARLTQWRSTVTSLRRLLGHADTRVREEAVKAVGALAGPALVPSVRMLLNDNSPEVRSAAVSALMKLEAG